jgi:hypothetical protein
LKAGNYNKRGWSRELTVGCPMEVAPYPASGLT